MKNNILIFDFDGTLADTLSHLVKISNRLAVEFNFKKIEPHHMSDLQAMTSQKILKHLNIPILKIPRILDKAKKEMHKEIPLIQPIQGIRQILHNLKSKGHQLGILSTNSTKNVTTFLKRHNLDIFDFIHTSARPWGKNHALKKIIKQNKFLPEKILFIGDETRDIEAAQKVKIQVAAVTWGYNTKDVLKKHNPDYLIHNPEELLNIVLKNI